MTECAQRPVPGLRDVELGGRRRRVQHLTNAAAMLPPDCPRNSPAGGRRKRRGSEDIEMRCISGGSSAARDRWRVGPRPRRYDGNAPVESRGCLDENGIRLHRGNYAASAHLGVAENWRVGHQTQQGERDGGHRERPGSPLFPTAHMAILALITRHLPAPVFTHSKCYRGAMVHSVRNVTEGDHVER